MQDINADISELLKQLSRIGATGITVMCNQKKGKKLHINQSISHRSATLCWGCTCPRATCPSASQHPEIHQLTVSAKAREREIGFHLYSPGTQRGKKEKGGCEPISRYIVSCHFYSTQNALTVTDLFFLPSGHAQSRTQMITWHFTRSLLTKHFILSFVFILIPKTKFQLDKLNSGHMSSTLLKCQWASQCAS